MAIKSKFKIRNIEISPPLALAPMVGLSHSALRNLVLEIGGVGLLFTEMLSAKRLPDENENISPLLIKSSNEYPLIHQVFLNDLSTIQPAVEKLHKIGAHGIDLNLGCPAPNLRKRGAGCALTQDHEIVKKVIADFRKSTHLPLTVKIRLGNTLESKRFLELCQIIEDEGADCLTIHARLNKEKFCRKPRWHCIALAKNNLTIPVIANGGVFSVEDAKKCLEISEADGLMLGRGAVFKPWLFSQISQELFGIPPKNDKIMVHDIYFRFISLLVEKFSQERRLGRLKQFTHYFSDSYMYGHRLASAIQNSDSMELAIEKSKRFFEANEPLTICGVPHD